MSEGSPEPAGAKRDPGELTLRARPRPVARLNRKALIGLVALGSLALLVLALIALDPPRLTDREPGRELFNTTRVPTAEGLAELPADYGAVAPPAEPAEPAEEPAPPALGPPLPGDLGPGMLEAERQLGITEPLPPALPDAGFRPDPQEEAARLDRMRLVREREEAALSGLFFAVDSAGPAAAMPDPAALVSPPGTAEAEAVDPAPPPLGHGAADAPQDPRLAFLEHGPDADIYNPHALQDPVSPYQLMAGTVIAAGLLTGLNSDLPGPVIAQVTQPVHDTVTGRHLLIPQGSRLLGRYDSRVAFGQDRVLVVWQRLILPDGASIVLDNLPGADTAGRAGLRDRVDHHTGRLLRGIALATLLGLGTELAARDDTDPLIAAGRDSALDRANDAGQEITRRTLDIQPTLTVRPGFPIRVIVNRDLVLRPYRG
jgi:type IV secretion system protein VirB10